MAVAPKRILYHATIHPLKEGQLCEPDSPTIFYPNVAAALQAKNPLPGISRQRCLFATDDPRWAMIYGRGQRWQTPFKLFAVEMKEYSVGPFRLIYQINERQEAGRSIDKLVREYWEPEHKWRFLEVFGPSFLVLGEVDPPTTAAENDAYNIYHADINFARDTNWD